MIYYLPSNFCYNYTARGCIRLSSQPILMILISSLWDLVMAVFMFLNPWNQRESGVPCLLMKMVQALAQTLSQLIRSNSYQGELYITSYAPQDCFKGVIVRNGMLQDTELLLRHSVEQRICCRPWAWRSLSLPDLQKFNKER